MMGHVQFCCINRRAALRTSISCNRQTPQVNPMSFKVYNKVNVIFRICSTIRRIQQKGITVGIDRELVTFPRIARLASEEKITPFVGKRSPLGLRPEVLNLLAWPAIRKILFTVATLTVLHAGQTLDDISMSVSAFRRR